MATPISQMDINPTFLEAYGITPQPVCHAWSLWPILKGETDDMPGRITIMTETNGSLASAPKGLKPSKARAVCDGRFYYIGNVYQDTFKGPVENALSIGSGSGEYGDTGPQFSINLHDETVRHKADQPLPYELLRQICKNDAPKEEFYDRDTDPWAVNNLVDDAAQAQTIARLRKEFTDWRSFTKDDDEPFKLVGGRMME